MDRNHALLRFRRGLVSYSFCLGYNLPQVTIAELRTTKNSRSFFVTAHEVRSLTNLVISYYYQVPILSFTSDVIAVPVEAQGCLSLCKLIP